MNNTSRGFFVPPEEDALTTSGEGSVRNESAIIPDISREQAISVYQQVIEAKNAGHLFDDLGLLLATSHHLHRVSDEDQALYPASISGQMLPVIYECTNALLAEVHDLPED